MPASLNNNSLQCLKRIEYVCCLCCLYGTSAIALIQTTRFVCCFSLLFTCRLHSFVRSFHFNPFRSVPFLRYSYLDLMSFFLSFILVVVAVVEFFFLLLYSNSFNQIVVVAAGWTKHCIDIMNLLSKFQSIWLGLCYMIANGNLYAHAHAWCSRNKKQRHLFLFIQYSLHFLLLCRIEYIFCDMQWDDNKITQ